MAQYQSFPGVPGDSRTLEKLKGLRLPPLDGKRFLDVGCNEGFFCGFAHFEGAQRSVGIDHSAGFIKRARSRFPGCEFRQQAWDSLPSGEFDVILLASALHYADDQPALIDALVARLAPGGTLVLELGIVSSERAEWVKVERGIDERYFPTMPMLRKVLARHAWKWMGPSVQQAGDPVSRHVVHVQRRRPQAYLLMQPPGYGKSSIASSLFGDSQVPLVSGDEILRRIANGELRVSRALKKAVSAEYSPYHLDRVLERIFANDHGADLVKVWVAQTTGGDFAFEGFVPEQWHGLVQRSLIERGYLPITLNWDRIGVAPLSTEALSQRADAYFSSLSGSDQGKQDNWGRTSSTSAGRGFVDAIEINDKSVRIRGWALDMGGRSADRFVLDALGSRVQLSGVRRSRRLNVVERLGRGEVECGFDVKIELNHLRPVDWVRDFKLFASNRDGSSTWRLRVASKLRERIAGGSGPLSFGDVDEARR